MDHNFYRSKPGQAWNPHHTIGGKQEVPSIWQILSDRGLSSVVMNDLITYPPIEIQGVMVSGGFTTPSESENFTFPSKIQKEIDTLIDSYKPSLDKNSLKKRVKEI